MQRCWTASLGRSVAPEVETMTCEYEEGELEVENETYGVDDKRRDIVLDNNLFNHLYRLCSSKHACFIVSACHGTSNADTRRFTSLDNINTNILNTGLNLLSNKLGRNDVDGLDALSVLRREGRGGRHGVAAMSGDDFLICLESTANKQTLANKS